jgi:hypothetical protein
MYNFISFFFYNSKNTIKYQNNLFIITESNQFEWRFSLPSRGFFYLNGIESRGKLLHSQYLIDKINFNDGDVVIDCGANSGDFFLNFKAKIQYYGVEPSIAYFKILSENIINQNLINKCLYKSENETINFYLDDENADSSIIPIKKYNKIVSVSTTTLDSMINQIKKSVKLIKVEAEGAEIEVLEGLEKEISKVEYITIDCGFERGIEKKSTLVECTNYLLARNYELIDFSLDRIILLFKNKLPSNL